MFSGYSELKGLGRRRRTVPTHLTKEVDSDLSQSHIYGNGVGLFQMSSRLQEVFGDRTPEEIQKLAEKIGWIYSDIQHLVGLAIGAEEKVLSVEKQTGRSKPFLKHPFLEAWENPNPHMSREYLLGSIVHWLQISDRGAFVFMAPKVDKQGKFIPNTIGELWPVSSNRIEPVKDRNHFVKHFRYTTGGHGTNRAVRQYDIPAEMVLWYRYPDPQDMWGSLPPLLAALVPAQIELGIQERERAFYTNSKGVPLSIVSLDPNLSSSDFASAKEEIRRDWEDDGTTVAITRGGSIKIESLGFTQQQLEIIEAQNLLRDDIDTIFLGMPLRGAALTNGDSLKEVNKIIVENRGWPLLKLIAGTNNTQGINRHYPSTGVFSFQDIRTTDKAIEIQNKTVEAGWSTVDEMRQREGKPPISVPQLEGFGDLPVRLSSNIAFIGAIYGLDIGGANEDGQNQPAEPKVGNLPGLKAPKALINEKVNTSKAVDVTQLIAMKEELSQLAKVAKKGMDNLDGFKFIAHDAADGNVIKSLVSLNGLEYISQLKREYSDRISSETK